MHDDQAETALDTWTHRQPLRAERDLARGFRQRLGDEPSPTELAKNDVVGVAVSAANALNHEIGFASGDIL